MGIRDSLDACPILHSSLVIAVQQHGADQQAGQTYAGTNQQIRQTCTFACHWDAAGIDYYQLAVKQNIQLRITVPQAAVGFLTDTLVELDANNYYRRGLYTFNQDFATIYPLSQNVAAADPQSLQLHHGLISVQTISHAQIPIFQVLWRR